MNTLLGAFGVALITVVLWEAFETIVLPRRVTRRYRATRLFYRYSWLPWAWLTSWIKRPRRREAFLAVYGPISLLLLLGFWALGLVVGFGVLHYGLRTEILPADRSFWTYLYMSGTTFFTLGYGDVVPIRTGGRALAVLESGMGFGFLAVIIGYIPMLSQAFSHREVNIALLDARAGTPPTVAELIRRQTGETAQRDLNQLLHDWERWSAELMESHLSYPVLTFFRSQHDNQSWLAALTAVLDTCAVLLVARSDCGRQAELTFAMARHAVVDMSQVLGLPPDSGAPDRLQNAEVDVLRALLNDRGIQLPSTPEAQAKFTELRGLYEPYVTSLARFLYISLPPWVESHEKVDNWQTSAWKMQKDAALGTAFPSDDHF